MIIFLYTALFGDYDELKEHNHPKEYSLCFTDRKDLVSESWTIVNLNKEFNTIDERIRFARFYKTNPHLVLPAHKYSIWVDASLQINSEYLKVVNFLEKSGLATFKYPSIYGTRVCTYEEGIACINRGKDSKDIIQKQMQRYKENGFPENYGLVETTIVVRENTAIIRRFNKFWWKEIQKGSRRDQLSFNYTCWKLNISYSLLPGYRLNNPFSTYLIHKEQVYSGSPYSTDDN